MIKAAERCGIDFVRGVDFAGRERCLVWDRIFSTSAFGPKRTLPALTKSRLLLSMTPMEKPPPSHWPIYKAGGIAVLPHTVQAEGGALFETTPYRSVDLAEASLTQTLRAIFAVSNTRFVSRFSDNDVPMDRPAFLKLLGVKSEGALQAQSQRWEVQRQNGRFTIEKWTPGASRGSYERTVLGSDLGIDEAAREMALALTV